MVNGNPREDCMPSTSRNHHRPTAGRAARATATALLGLLAGIAWAAAEDAPAPGAGSGAAPAGAASPADVEALRRRIADLEAQIARLREEMARAAGGGAGAAGAARAGAANATIEARITALEKEIAALRTASPVAAAGAAAAVAPKSANGFAPGASRPFVARGGLTFGGYGSGLYQKFTEHRDNDTDANLSNLANLPEAFVYVGFRFDAHWVFDASFGITDAAAGDGQPGQATVEFAFVDYRWRPSLGARGGLVLLPLGFLNEQHEPNSWLGARRPEVETRIIPTTWREAGGGLYGEAGEAFAWRAYATTGLDASGFEPATGVAGGRQQGAAARATDIALSARADWTPFRSDASGRLLAGASVVTGKTGQKEPGFPAGRFTLWDAHAEYRWHGLQIRALYAQSILGDAGEISEAIDPALNTAIGEKMKGWYFEVGYDVLQIAASTDQSVYPFCRYEALNTQDEVAPGLTPDLQNDLTVKTCGVAWNPIRPIRITFDAQNFENQAHTAVDQVNLGLGWAF